jgi:hypothetical protein
MRNTAWSKRPEADRFWEKVDVTGDCWIWLGARLTRGHGVFKLRGQQMGAHRASWILSRGPIPDGPGYHGTCVCHRCDNPACVRPEHLFLGTIQDNLADMRSKGRDVHVSGERHGSKTKPHRIARGERTGSAILSESAVRDIRDRISRGETQTSIASHYGISQGTVSFVNTRRTWAHV